MIARRSCSATLWSRLGNVVTSMGPATGTDAASVIPALTAEVRRALVVEGGHAFAEILRGSQTAVGCQSFMALTN